MPAKDHIINNLRSYTPAEIAQFIRTGDISMYELSKSGRLTPLMRRRIEEQLAKPVEVAAPAPAPAEKPKVNEAPQPARPAQPAQTVQPIQPVQPPQPSRPTQPTQPVQPTSVPQPSPVSQPQVATPPPYQPDYETVSEPDYDDSYEQEESAYDYPMDLDTPVNLPPPAPPTPPVMARSNGVIDNHGMFRRCFSFKGRIRRTEYWLSGIISMIWYFGCALVLAHAMDLDIVDDVVKYHSIDYYMPVYDDSYDRISSYSDDFVIAAQDHADYANTLSKFGLIFLALQLPAMWFSWAQGVKRCHDVGSSGWCLLIPLYNPFVLLFGGSEEGTNKYGTNPKE